MNISSPISHFTLIVANNDRAIYIGGETTLKPGHMLIYNYLLYFRFSETFHVTAILSV